MWVGERLGAGAVEAVVRGSEGKGREGARKKQARRSAPPPPAPQQLTRVTASPQLFKMIDRVLNIPDDKIVVRPRRRPKPPRPRARHVR